MVFHRKHFIPVMLITLFLLNSCVACYFCTPKVWHTIEQDHLLPTAGIEALDVETYNGAITLRAVPGADEIKVHIKVKAGGENDLDAAACMDAIELLLEPEGSTQILAWKWREDKKPNWQAAVAFEIEAPPEFRVKAKSYNGQLSLEGVQAEATGVTYNGRVEVKAHQGNLDVETYNGRIEVAVTGSEVRLETYNGKIQAHLGAVSRLEGEATTYNGAVAIRMDGTPSTRIFCKTRNGDIDINKPMQAKSRDKRSYEGVLGAGEGKFRLETYNGSIRID